jgi:2',3'-cyclic-nucleotide 2'-phosphodiesterase (5'-nucleotidase family)
MQKRREFLKQAGLAGGGLVLSGTLRGDVPKSGIRTVSLLHTTDLHGHVLPTETYGGLGNVGGLARCAAQIRAWRKECSHSLLLDIGDVYQGTPTGWMTRGRLMIDLFNKLQYDAWVIGNHEFDWGPEVVLDALTRANMPVLTGNMILDGEPAGSGQDATNPLTKVVPHMVKELGGMRIGVIGMTTPGMPYWLRPELLAGFEVTDPAEMLKASVLYLREEAKVDAVVACGHMGWRDQDDFANPLRRLLEDEDCGVDVFLGGHTHRDHSSRYVGRTLYTQADYFGIHCGRVDLSFDLETRRLIEKRAFTLLMDERIAADPLVLEASKSELEEADAYLDSEVGELGGDLSGKQPHRGVGSPLQNLFGAAFEHAARKGGLEPDGVFHGTFGTDVFAAGKKKMADVWKVLPYENRLVALYLTRDELVSIYNESLEVRSDRALYGFEVDLGKAEAGKGEEGSDHFVRTLRSMRKADAPADHRFCILCNSYDAQSGGKRLMRLRALATQPESKASLLDLSSREALIDYFKDHELVTPGDVTA